MKFDRILNFIHRPKLPKMKPTIILCLLVCIAIISCNEKKRSQLSEAEVKEIYGKYIKYSEAREMFDLYLLKSSRGRAQTNIDSTRSVWFSVKELNAFLDDVYRVGRRNSVDFDSIGVRIYFGVYPDAEGVNHRRQMSLFMVGTEYINNGSTNINHDMVDRTANKIVGIDPYNNGTLCPPNSCVGQEF